jgi:hypothetical protein
MGASGSSSLGSLTEKVKRAFAGLPGDLRKTLYMDSAVKSLDGPVVELCDLIQAELSRHPDYANRSAVRDVLKSLRSVESSIQLLITASREYATSRNLAEKHEIQEAWMHRKERLVDQADSCAESLDVVLAFADQLASRPSVGESDGGKIAG